LRSSVYKLSVNRLFKQTLQIGHADIYIYIYLLGHAGIYIYLLVHADIHLNCSLRTPSVIDTLLLIIYSDISLQISTKVITISMMLFNKAHYMIQDKKFGPNNCVI